MSRLVVVDMGVGNLESVAGAFERVGAAVQVTAQAADLEHAAAVVLPGVGAFGDGMASLRHNRLVEPLLRHVREKKRPLLGICLGMQLLAEAGEEQGRHQGLGLLRGRVVRLDPGGGDCRVPNMGWCDVRAHDRRGVLFAAAGDGECFYFAHSYHLQCPDEDAVAATIRFGRSAVVAAVERGSLFGVQFHPEKSQDAGLDVLASFLDHVRRREGA